ncbi:MAG: serine/threonine protein kinase [Acidobacteriota bacterium]|nr:MAG: serine/threonine protein kinase [Acidobacteriota bacterium]
MTEAPTYSTKPLPKKLGRYKIVSEVGKGSMGVVYKAKDPTIGRHVALKTLNFALPLSEKEETEFRARFFREAQAAGNLVHPNIIQIYDVGEEAETHTAFIAMEFAPGANLRDFMVSDQLLPIPKILDIMKQLARALDYAHQRNVIHRDIKPANLILTTAGELKITDFGIAKIPQSSLTQTGKLLGTPYYMAPEQILGTDLDHRADIFSAGIIFYQLLTGRLPFSGSSMAAVAYQIVNTDAPSPSKHRTDLPEGIEDILAKMLAKKAQNRYARALDIIQAIEDFEAEERAKQATAQPWWARLEGELRRSPAMLAALIGIPLLGFVLVLGVGFWSRSKNSSHNSAGEIVELPPPFVAEAALEELPVPEGGMPPTEQAPSTQEEAISPPAPAEEPPKQEAKEQPPPLPPPKPEPAPRPVRTPPAEKPPPAPRQKAPPKARKVEVALGLKHKLDSGTVTVKNEKGRTLLRDAFEKEKKGVKKRFTRFFKKGFDWENVLTVYEGTRTLAITLGGQEGEKRFLARCDLRHAFSPDVERAIHMQASWKKGEAVLECSVEEEVVEEEKEKKE